MCDYQPDVSTATHVIRETIASRRDSVDEASERIMQAVAALPCARGSLDDISLALSEALANAVVHGNREDPDKNVDVCAACEGPDQFTLVITDEGRGFLPDAVADPTAADNLLSSHGRGLFLIRQLMDNTEFRLGGRQIVLLKRRQHPPGHDSAPPVGVAVASFALALPTGCHAATESRCCGATGHPSRL